jgi:hypothetical protein
MNIGEEEYFAEIIEKEKAKQSSRYHHHHGCP